MLHKDNKIEVLCGFYLITKILNNRRNGEELKFTEQEIDDAELKTEEILCINCNIIHDEKDCSSCEDYYKLRDKLLVSK